MALEKKPQVGDHVRDRKDRVWLIVGWLAGFPTIAKTERRTEHGVEHSMFIAEFARRDDGSPGPAFNKNMTLVEHARVGTLCASTCSKCAALRHDEATS